MIRTRLQVCLALVVLVISASPAAAAPFIETLVLAAGGQSSPAFPNPPPFSCSTYAGLPQVTSYFGTSGVSRPVEGFSECNIASAFNYQTATSGTLSDSKVLSTTFNGAQNSFSGSVKAKAAFGVVGAEAHGTFGGPSNSFIVDGAEAFGKARDTFTITSPSIPNGTPGEFRFSFYVDGSLIVNGPDPYTSAGDVEVMYQKDAEPIYILMRGQVTRASQQPFLALPSGSVFNPGVYGGWTLTLGSISGGDVSKTFVLQFKYGEPFDFTIGILAYVIPSTGATVDVNFFSTARLSGIEVFNQNGQPVTNFSISSGSGTLYDKSGLKIDADGDGFGPSDGDCNDANATINPGAAEACDGVDNNCDAIVDNNVSGVGIACSTGIPGICTVGITSCVSGVLSCQQTQVPAVEACDGIDNDCDGSIDEGFDTDGDGTANCNDSCPSDSKKVVPGACGCGATDADTDADSVADCNDGCPLLSLKVAPGVCGCSGGDFDSDGDGTFDCKDQCPDDPARSAAGVCGCSAVEVDRDKDGIFDCLIALTIQSKCTRIDQLLRKFNQTRRPMSNRNRKIRNDVLTLLKAIQKLVNANITTLEKNPASPTVLQRAADVDKLCKAAVTPAKNLPARRVRARNALKLLKRAL